MTDFVSGQTLTADELNTAFAATGTGSVTEVVSGAGLHTGTITNSGTLLADWNAGTVSALGTGLGRHHLANLAWWHRHRPGQRPDPVGGHPERHRRRARLGHLGGVGRRSP